MSGPPKQAKFIWNGDPHALRTWLEGGETNTTKFDSGKLLINEPMMQLLPDYTAKYWAAKAEVSALEEEIQKMDDAQDFWWENRFLYPFLHTTQTFDEYFADLNQRRQDARDKRRAKLQEARNWDVLRHAVAMMHKRSLKEHKK